MIRTVCDGRSVTHAFILRFSAQDSGLPVAAGDLVHQPETRVGPEGHAVSDRAIEIDYVGGPSFLPISVVFANTITRIVCLLV